MANLLNLFFILFPLGKIIKIGFINPIDLVVLLVSLNYLLKKPKIPSVILNLFIFFSFSLLFSLSFFEPSKIIIGALYLIRFFAYLLFSLQVYVLIKKNKISRDDLIKRLLIVGLVIAILGWLQYFLIPDTRFLKNFGWDDHYYRLLSTYLDPAYTGILLVLTFILSTGSYLKIKLKKYLFLSVFLLISIGFTYSRASFIALFIALVYLLYKYKQKVILFLILFLLILIPLLPRPYGEGVKLERTYSVNQKFINYQDSLKLISQSPIFGVGFDNLCIAKEKFLKEVNLSSHTCSGLDNSFLFLLASTGTVGLIGFLSFVSWIIKNREQGLYGNILVTSLITVSIHALFTNTIFYNFVLGWLALIMAIGLKLKENN